MVGRTHDLIAFASLVTTAAIYPPETFNLPTMMTCIVGNVVGALIPDMDQASNRLWDLLPAGNLMGRIFRNLFIGHRTISHSLMGGVILYKFLEFTLPKLFNSAYVDTRLLLISIMIGFISHLFADGVTKEGIPLFFPLRVKVGFPPIKLLRITTDSWVEHLIVLPLTVVYIAYIFVSYQGVFLTLLRNIKS